MPSLHCILYTISLLVPWITCEITGSYPIVLATPAPVAPDAPGKDVNNYPSCSVRFQRPPGSIRSNAKDNFQQQCYQFDTQALKICPADSTDPSCYCGAKFRASGAGCQAVTCDDAEYQSSIPSTRILTPPSPGPFSLSNSAPLLTTHQKAQRCPSIYARQSTL